MEAKKLTGYIVAGVGIVILAFGTVPNLRAPLTFIPEAIKDIYLIGAGALIAAIGAILSVGGGGGSNKVKEVPIYQGKEVVGFRRIGK